jgi:hypothetical protein
MQSSNDKTRGLKSVTEHNARDIQRVHSKFTGRVIVNWSEGVAVDEEVFTRKSLCQPIYDTTGDGAR